MRTQLEHLVELLYMRRREAGSAEGDVHSLPKLAADAAERVAVSEAEAELLSRGLARRAGEQLQLTPAGEAMALDLTRRNRLAERLLSDVLQVDEEEVSQGACQMEHVLSPAVSDSICTLLGHPPVCPHGKPIPPGSCCEGGVRDIKPVVVSLAEAPIGQEARISFVGSRTAGRIERLASLGITSGSSIRLVQRRPAVVVESGQTRVALDDDIAREIFVRLNGAP